MNCQLIYKIFTCFHGVKTPKYINNNMGQNYVYIKFRIMPTKSQEAQFLAHCDAARFVYNNLLEHNIKLYTETKKFDFGLQLPNQIKSLRKQHIWLKSVNSQSLQQAAINLGIAFKNRFSKKSKNNIGFPKFKSKRNNRQSFSVPQHFSISDNQIKLPKIGRIEIINHRPLVGKAKSITVVKEIDRWYASILCEYQKSQPEINYQSVVGIDVGIKTFAVTSDGECLTMPKFEKETKQLKSLQRKFSKKVNGSNNRNKSRILVAKQYAEIRRKKTNIINNFVSAITKSYDIVVMEDLNIAGMKKNKKLASSIHQLPWAMFKLKLQQKSKMFVEASRWFPSSKTCSCCGWINKDLQLSQRVFNCDNCGLEIDRDLNAAINLKKYRCNGGN